MKVKKNKALLGQLSDMDLRLLQVYKAVVDCGGFSAAELELNIGVSTISRHIKDLEIRLGLVLCQRGRSGFALTDQGQRVYEEATKLFAALNGFRASIDEIHGRIGGVINIALFEKNNQQPKRQNRTGDCSICGASACGHTEPACATDQRNRARHD